MNKKSLKYYVYVSNSKVEMLYSQIPRRFFDGMSAELKVSLGVASSVLTQKAAEETIYSKLSVVLRYIYEYGAVGSIDNPEDYFSGTAMVRWGLYDSQNTLVLFVGSTNETIFGIGGSLAHLLGAKPEANTPYVSTTPFLVDLLCQDLDLQALNEQERHNMALLLNEGRNKAEMALWAVEHANKYMNSASQKVEFVAKRLLHKEKEFKNDKGVLLGTPLYVALAE